MDPHFDGVISRPTRRSSPPHAQPASPFLILDVRSAEQRSRGIILGVVAHRSADLEALPPGTDAKTEFVVVGHDLADAEVRRTTNRLRELGAHRVVSHGGMLSGSTSAPTSKAA